jgi:glycogen debranching enzyme
MPITINESTTFFIADELGDVPEGEANGLFSEDTRFLSQYLLQLDGQAPLVLAADQVDYRTAEHFLTNPELPHAPGSTLGIVRRRIVGKGLRDEISLCNFGDNHLSCTLELLIDADFAGIFDVKRSTRIDKEAIRGLGTFSPTVENGGRIIRLCFERGHFHRELVVHLSQPIAVDPNHCSATIRLAPRETWQLTIEFATITTSHTGATPRPELPEQAGEEAERAEQEAKGTGPAAMEPPASAPGAPASIPPATTSRQAAIISKAPALRTDSYILHRAYERTVHDFAALRLRGEAICEGNLVLAAGIPWYMALFGRDSLIASYQALAFDPELAIGTLRALASLQGDKFDPERAEEPGKILHEHRFGTIAGPQRGIPRYPYYGSVDSTPLFLILLAALCRLTGNFAYARELRPNALRALEWIERYGDPDRDGYLEYQGRSNGLTNQGWKDSWDSVRFRDGRIAAGPIALSEVQGYAYAARLGLATIFDALGESDRATGLRTDARLLKERFNRDFWLPDRDFFAEALDGEKRPVDSLTSNPGHLLWTGIVDDEKARAIAETLLSPNLFSGWGVRTMALTEGGYNPVSYHNGSVWPHDNSLIVAGLMRYGFNMEAMRIVDGLIAALGHSPDHRLPELFAGYGRDQAHAPVQYPTACRPQAWASGSIFLALAAATGMELDGGSFTFDAFPYLPMLPTGINEIRLDGLRATGHRVTVTLLRKDGRITRQVERWHGEERTAA